MKTYYELLNDFCIALLQNGYKQPKSLTVDEVTMKRFRDQIDTELKLRRAKIVNTYHIDGPVEIIQHTESRNLIVYAPEGDLLNPTLWYATRDDCDSEKFESKTVKLNVNVKLIEE